MSESDDENGDSALTYAAKISFEPTKRPFKFRSLAELNKKEIDSPTSSPIPWPSPEVFNISSDEELEQSMIEIEKEVTNGN